jgi:hypothetical protein
VIAPPSPRARSRLGVAVWLALLGGLVALFAAPGVRGPLGRTVHTLLEPWRDAPERERRFEGPSYGARLGDPVFEARGEGLGEPVGHVVAVEAQALRVRFEPGFGGARGLEDLEVECLAPSRTLGEALALALPPESVRRLGLALRERLGVTFEEALEPELKARLPAFLARVDPRKDPRASAEVQALGHAVMQRLAPLLDGLTREVTRAVDQRFDLLDRLGLLWKMVKGDGEGLRKELLPVAKEAAQRWWSEHATEVLEALGQGLADRGPELGDWLAGPVWDAAQTELLLPIAHAQRARLEAEAQGLLEAALAEVVLAPGGGLRPRFAHVVRTHLLGHRAPLLLVRVVARSEPAEGAR